MFRFRLRTLLITVAMLAVPMAWANYSLHWIEARRVALGKDNFCFLIPSDAPRAAPGGLWLLGEKGYVRLGVIVMTRDEVERRNVVDEVKRLFPEATVVDIADEPTDNP